MNKTSYTGQFKPSVAVRNKKGTLVASSYQTRTDGKITFFNFRGGARVVISQQKFERDYQIGAL